MRTPIFDLPKYTLALCALAPTTAFAFGCPTGENMAVGVLVQHDNGGYHQFQETEPNWVRVRSVFPTDKPRKFGNTNWSGLFMSFYKGLYQHDSTPVKESQEQKEKEGIYISRADLLKWNSPRPGSTWTYTFPSGGKAVSDPIKAMKIDDCTYRGFDVQLTFHGDDTYKETYFYIPERGIVLITQIDKGEEPELYAYTRILKKSDPRFLK